MSETKKKNAKNLAELTNQLDTDTLENFEFFMKGYMAGIRAATEKKAESVKSHVPAQPRA